MNIRPKAASILVQHRVIKNLVLTASRRGKPNELGLIGGKQDEGETIEECAIREFFEETGVKLKSTPQKIFEDISEAGQDGIEFYTTTFQVVDQDDLYNLEKVFTIPSEVEKDILVGYADKQKVFDGPFGAYNKRLFKAMSESV